MGSRGRTVLICALIIFVGVGGFLILKATKPAPPEKKVDRARRLVRVLEVKKGDYRARIEESGTVEPKTALELTAEVMGRITYVSENLKVGYFATEGELLIEIDPREYHLSVVQSQAEIAQLKAEMSKIKQEKQNLSRNLEVQEERLRLSRLELERKKKLVDSGSLSHSEFDRQGIETKAMEASALNHRNSISLLKSQNDLIQAKIDATEAKREMARLKLEKTKISAPFNGRVREESVEEGQYVTVGEKLANIYDISAMEVIINIPPRRMGLLLRRDSGESVHPAFTSLAQVNEWIKKIGPSGTVRFRVGDRKRTWKCKVTRIQGALEAATRTVPVVVEVKRPFSGARAGKSPPLVPGMFVDVVLEGQLLRNVVEIPRSALHNGSVYLVTGGKLEIRKVKIAMITRKHAIVREGLENGENLVVSPIAVPVPGTEVRIAAEE